MEISLVRSRYKVTGVIRAEENYTAYRAVNIESGSVREYLVNVYEGEYARRYAACFDSLRHCREFCEVFIEDGALVSVFGYTDAPDIDGIFRKGAVIPWRTRLEYAGLLFRLALSVSDYPKEIARAAFYSENLIPLLKESGLAVNFAVRPSGEDGREIIGVLTSQVKKILRRRFGSPGAEIDFIEEMSSGRFDGIVKLCSRWQDAGREITEEYEALDALKEPGRTIKLITAELKRRAANKKARQGRGKGGETR